MIASSFSLAQDCRGTGMRGVTRFHERSKPKHYTRRPRERNLPERRTSCPERHPGWHSGCRQTTLWAGISAQPKERNHMTDSRRERVRGSIFRDKGSSNWRIKYSDRGRTHREGTHSPDKKVAEKLLRLRLAEITTGTFTPRSRVYMEELIAD